ncbi:hypothetical protein E1293_43550 [Actinomadura darangshiensis]|uniref:Uncharacterized protein n=1 Tax=Actinomadura darangshiensis TaxID=705336 RepID=A0A4R4ZUY4_9ACTN|nr:hypothetical protein [Actinomadura darangshiensis]TDD62978.1 hypothetical protein E1293_43550 [Actinomadura darangshiensis]
MAPPPFSMYSPKTPEGGGGPSVAPVFGAGPADDPGYLASLRGGTELGRLRLMMLALLAAPVLILAIMPLIVEGGGGEAPAWLYPPLAAAALLALLAGPRAPRPMEPRDEREAAALAALMMFRQAVLLRFALAEGVILLGLPLAMVGHSELVFVAGFVLGYPLLVWLALPTRGGVERMRRRMESAGAESHLWAVLLAAPMAAGAAPSARETPPEDGDGG